MAKPFTEWTVLPHGRLTQVDENVLTVTGSLHMPIGRFPRRMTIARLQSGSLVIFNGIALSESEMRVIEAFGTPRYLVVPSDIHRQDAAIWKKRYPHMIVLAPPGAKAKVEEVVHVDDAAFDLQDPNVRLTIVDGTGEEEYALEIRGSGGLTLVVNDVISNMPLRSGVRGVLLRWLGFAAGTANIPRIVLMRKIKDRAALKRQLEMWGQEQVRRIVPSHGITIEAQASNTLRSLASSL